MSSEHRFADFDGVKVHYEAFGTGAKALVFIHGWACSVQMWRQSLREFPEYRVVAVDLPGHGRSDKPRTRYSMEYFARGIEAVLRDARIEAAVLVGHSMGTPVIRQFNRLYPERTLGLVAVDGQLQAVVAKEDSRRGVARICANYPEEAPKLVESMLQPIRSEELRQNIRTIMLATPEHVGSSAAQASLDESIWTQDPINVPTLAILAKDIPWWPADTEPRYRAIAPDLDFQLWPKVSHFLMMERPTAFNDALRVFVTSKKLL